ncbi:hypothetical protein PoB_003445200 [Plakobranchus ocellatus]|uniref:C-type lectin domain-containing protein n=1 Tax=Plakobranchus ocellatus TaxID=259542 RepID=A0AAV4ALY7_9GAST|nr:hypothetical protein PoB_003445200 [Plakobranchus ocellatus]
MYEDVPPLSTMKEDECQYTHWEYPSYANWHRNVTKEDCAGIMKKDKQRAWWYPYDCSSSLRYICERPPPPQCYHQGKAYTQGSKLSLHDRCGNPHTCFRSTWIFSIDQCRWNGTCLNLYEIRDGLTCIMNKRNRPEMTNFRKGW